MNLYWYNLYTANKPQTNSILIFFNFQINSLNILLHIKLVTFSQFMTPISLIVPIMKENYSEIMMLNIDYYVQCAI